MRDTFTARVSSLALVLAALSTLGAVIYLSVRGEQVNEYLAGLAGLTVGALLPSPLSSSPSSSPSSSLSSSRVSSGRTPSRSEQGRHRLSRSSADLAR